jgi:eukaryotic-like serine/threonine-protein kinase
VPSKVILEVVSGPIHGTVFPFEKHDTFLFGRHRDCHARFPKDPLVSRHHFILEVNPPDARIRDLGSLNGTYVNGQKHGGRAPEERPDDASGRRYPAVDLRNGDRVTVGNTTIVVKVELPCACCQCGVEIPEAEKPQAEWMPGSFMCPTCRANMQTQNRPRTIVEVLRCERCGKDVSAEVLNGRRGEYICASCRESLVADAGGLRRLMQEAARNYRGPEAPSIAGYEIGDELGKGGMGVVYRARRLADNQTVAVKVMLAKIAVDENARKLFLREIETARTLQHPNIVSLLESNSAGSAFYFVMDYCNGGSLDHLIARQGGKLPFSMAAPIMAQCLRGLDYAHQRKYVHRDLKPQNVLLDNTSGKWTPRITDFGLSKNFEMAGLSGMTATGSYGGTYCFMPREQLTDFKYLQPASDVWSMAATFYNMLTGCFPLSFPANRDPVEVILHDEPTPVRQHEPAVPAAVADCIDRGLATDRAKRFQTAAEMLSAFERALK